MSSTAAIVFVVDWDDVIFPASHLTSSISSMSQKRQLTADDAKIWDEIDKTAKKLLEILDCLGKIVIITNFEKGWIEHSSASFLPDVNAFLTKNQDIQKFSVNNEGFSQTYGKDNLFNAIINQTFAQIEGDVSLSMIVIGSSTDSTRAAYKAATEFQHPRNLFIENSRRMSLTTKVIKFKDIPSITELTSEQRLIGQSIKGLLAYSEALHVELQSHV